MIGRIFRIPSGIDYEGEVAIVVTGQDEPVPLWRALVIDPGSDWHGEQATISKAHLAAMSEPLDDVEAAARLDEVSRRWRDAAIVAAAAAGSSHRQIAVRAGRSQPTISDIVARG